MPTMLSPSPSSFAPLVPDVESIRAELERTEAEATILRRLLRLALHRQREAARLAQQEVASAQAS